MRGVETILAIPLAAVPAACAKGVPPEEAANAGEWSAPTMALAIAQDGTVAYDRKKGAATTSINAPLKQFQGEDFIAGLGPAATTFVVSAPRHRDGNAWKMTVGGVEPTRTP
jgi:hypothetical protein